MEAAPRDDSWLARVVDLLLRPELAGLGTALAAIVHSISQPGRAVVTVRTFARVREVLPGDAAGGRA